jgi:hypothetical protein
MAIIDLYSKRKKRTAMAGKAEVYRYDTLPKKLRVQIIGIWKAAIACFRQPELYTQGHATHLWNEIHALLAHERGAHFLADGRTSFDRCCAYLEQHTDIDELRMLSNLRFK